MVVIVIAVDGCLFFIHCVAWNVTLVEWDDAYLLACVLVNLSSQQQQKYEFM